MYIEPRTNIRILKDVPLDTTYEHTIYFENAQAQYDYFIGLQKYNLTNYSYQRVQRGIARVGIKADNLYDCNYMMFQNSAYGNKWFYAYITSVEFLNNETSEISFEIDVMQTWFFDCDPDYCFVEREHSLTDNVGEHIEPENVATGEAVFNTYEIVSSKLTPFCIVCLVSDQDESPDGNVYGGVFSGATMHAFNITDVDGVIAFLNKYVQKPDAIVAMYMCPVNALPGFPPSGGSKVSMTATCKYIESELDRLTGTETIDGYTPKNKKLYTYPYNYLLVTDCSADSLTLRYEFFDNLTPKFGINMSMVMPVQCLLAPIGYKGVSTENDSETLTLKNYPMCAWSTDAFKAWVAQNSLPIGANIVTSVAGGAVTGATAGSVVPGIGTVMGALSGTASGLLSSTLSALSSTYSASIQADPVKGSQNNGSINVGRGRQSFYCGRMSVTKEYARMIDDFFTMYGYATRRCKKPNRNSRPHWNYVKTIGCTVTGSVPADDMKKICRIYDKGITFWKSGSEVGDYSLDNSPV